MLRSVLTKVVFRITGSLNKYGSTHKRIDASARPGERSIPHELGGEAEIDYRVTGLEARIVLPARMYRLDAAAGDKQTGKVAEPSDDPAEPSRSAAMPGHVLLVEDSLIIALDAEEALLSQGVGRVSVASSVEQALAVLEEETIDAALLDLNLGSQLSLPVAEVLAARSIPFAFVTGYADGIDVGTRFAAIPVLQKPYGSEDLSRILLQLA